MITSYLPEVSPASLVAESAMNSKVTFETLPLSPQYESFAVNTILTPTERESNLYGPVPLGASDKSSTSFADAGNIFSQYIRAGSTPSRATVLICTVVASTAVAPVRLL